MSAQEPRFGVVIPVHNEPRLALLLQRFDFATTPDVVIVDDGSTDNSLDVARRYPVVVLSHAQRTGVGAAIRTGLQYLKERSFDWVVVMAGNNKDNPTEIPILLEALHQGADYVQGSRFLERKHAQATPLHRRIITSGVALLWSVRFARRLTEVTNGFRAYRLSLLDHPAVNYTQDWLNRYELEYYLHYKVLLLKLRYVEVPVTKRYPTDGLPTSKIKLLQDSWSLLRPLVLLTLRLRN